MKYGLSVICQYAQIINQSFVISQALVYFLSSISICCQRATVWLIEKDSHKVFSLFHVELSWFSMIHIWLHVEQVYIKSLQNPYWPKNQMDSK